MPWLLALFRHPMMLDVLIGVASFVLAGTSFLAIWLLSRLGRDVPTPLVVFGIATAVAGAAAFGIVYPIMGLMNLNTQAPAWRPALGVGYSLLLASTVFFTTFPLVADRFIRSEEDAERIAIITTIIILIGVFIEYMLIPPSAYIITCGNSTTVLL